jgi:hypothetical protein
MVKLLIPFSTLTLLAFLTACGGGGETTPTSSTTSTTQTSNEIYMSVANTQLAFVEEKLSFSSDTICANAVDLDKDGDVDFLCYDENNVFKWSENRGDFNLVDHEIGTTDDDIGFFDVESIDIDNDGDLDLYATEGRTVKLFVNDGNQNFSEHNISLSNYSWNVSPADIDNDGDIDFLASFDEEYFRWYENDGAFNFSEHNISTPNMDPYDVNGVDFDADGDIDFVMSTSHVDDKRIVWYENDGNQNFSESNISVSVSVANVKVVDINKDGFYDVVGTSGESVYLFLNDGNQNFSEQKISDKGAFLFKIIDIDSDGDLDIAGTSDYFEMLWLENDGDLNFTLHETGHYAGLMHFSDIDRDGKLDFISNISWWTQDHKGSWYRQSNGVASDENTLLVTTVNGESVSGSDLLYSISGADASLFNINSQSGELSFKIAPDYEVVHSGYYRVSVNATAKDTQESGSIDLIVLVNNIIDTPPTLMATALSVGEHAKEGAYVGDVSKFTDGDSDISSYTISSGDSDIFSVSADGKVQVAKDAILNFEDKSEYSLNVYATNEAGDSNIVDVNIRINDLVYYISQEVQPESLTMNDTFGSSIALDGSYLLVGAPRSNTDKNGSVYLLKIAETNTTEIAKLSPDEDTNASNYGYKVALDGDYIYITAPEYDTSTVVNSGAVYVYKKDSNNQVNYLTTLLIDDANEGDRLGSSIAVEGDYVVVGASVDDAPGANSGSVYIYKKDANDTFTNIAVLTASDAKDYDYFGTSVDINNGYIVVSALGKDIDSDNAYSGGAYLFKNDGSDNFVELDILAPETLQGNDYFGYDVAIEDGFIVVGAKQFSSDNGKAYLYQIENDKAVEKQTLLSGDSIDGFGYSVDMDGDYIFVGSLYSDATYLFELNKNDANATLIQTPKGEDTHWYEQYGCAVAIDTDHLIVGANYSDVPETDIGNLYIFNRDID